MEMMVRTGVVGYLLEYKFVGIRFVVNYKALSGL